MRMIGILGLACFLAGSANGSGSAASSMGVQKATTILLWDIPRTSQIRGTVTLQALPGRSVAPGFTVRVSLKAAGPGPDRAVIGMGSCTFYKKLYTLNPAVNGLSHTTIARASLPKLMKTPHAIVVLPKLAYCGVIP